MRMLGKLLLAVVLLAAVMPLFPRIAQSMRATMRHLRDAPEIEGTTVSQTYVLDQQEWMRFRLHSAAAVARVLTTASLTAPLPELDRTRVRPGWRYTIEYRIIDAGGRTVDERTFHFRAQVTLHEDLVHGGTTTANRWSHKNLLPADSRQLRIPLTQLDAVPHELHVRVATKEKEIADVAVRVAGLEEREDYDDPDLWQRLGAAQIASICEASIYPPELISAERRSDILHWRWRPLSPVGVEGRDYLRRVLYTSDGRSIRGAKAESNALSLIKPAQHLVFRLPEEEGHLQLNLKRETLDSRVAAVQGTWYPPHPGQAQAYRWEFGEQELARELQLPITGGRLELGSGQPILVEAHWRSSAGLASELTPHRFLTRTYACDAGGLSYCIRHVAGRATPVRVQFRRLLSRDSVPEPEIHWSLLDAEQRVLQAGSFPIGGQPSRYDRVDVVDSLQMISDPTTKYWRPAENVKFLHFSARCGVVYVAAANRPGDLPRTVEVRPPTLANLSQRSLHQTWFALRPETHSELCKTQRTLVVESQTRPPQLDQDVLANRYRWESFRPSSNWTGRYLMLSRRHPGTIRREAAEITFFEVPRNERMTISVPPEAIHSRAVALAYLAPSKTNHQLRVIFDDRKPIEIQLSGIGTAPLGSFLPGQYGLQVQAAEPLRVFLNAPLPFSSAPPVVYLKLFAVRANQSRFDFELEKQSSGPERLTLEYFATRPRSQPLKINVRVQSMPTATQSAVFDAWSCTEHQFLITPAGSRQPNGFVLGVSGTPQQIRDRQRGFVLLGDNIPAGPLRLSITGADSGDDYFLLYRITSGDYERSEWSSVSLPLSPPDPSHELE